MLCCVVLHPFVWLCLKGAVLVFLCLDFKVKELDKRASGQAFEVILGNSEPESKGDFPLSPQKKKDWSLEEIQKKLEAAEERRKVRLTPRSIRLTVADYHSVM